MYWISSEWREPLKSCALEEKKIRSRARHVNSLRCFNIPFAWKQDSVWCTKSVATTESRSTKKSILKTENLEKKLQMKAYNTGKTPNKKVARVLAKKSKDKLFGQVNNRNFLLVLCCKHNSHESTRCFAQTYSKLSIFFHLNLFQVKF